MPIAELDRTLIRLSGDNVQDWLSGLITNSLSDDCNFSALLTPQGKIIADFFVIKEGHDLILDVARKFADNVQKRLTLYRLRMPIEISLDDRSVYAAWDGTGDEGLKDPRHDDLGRRIIAESLTGEADENDYDLHRLSLGIPDSQRDFETADIFPANANMDILGGVDFKKGCFVGQEVVSRMYRKTAIKKRMRGFTVSGETREETLKQNDRVIGDVMYCNGALGIAMVRQDRLADDDFPIRLGDIVVELMDLPNGNTP